MQPCRSLEFQTLADVQTEVDRLLEGHTTVGQWTLGQILEHLARSIRLTTIGGRPSGAAAGPNEARRQFFERGRFPEGVQSPSARLIPPPETDLRAAAAALRDAMGAWAGATGPFPDHPLLGPLSRDEWERFHCMHCAHHLGFAVPA